MNTKPVTCPCGTVFEIELKRGRPAVYCETCRAMPYAARPKHPAVEAVPAAVAGLEGSVSAARSEFDDLAAHRDVISAEVETLEAAYKSNVAPLKAAWEANPTKENYAAIRKMADEFDAAVRAVYARFRK